MNKLLQLNKFAKALLTIPIYLRVIQYLLNVYVGFSSVLGLRSGDHGCMNGNRQSN